MHSVERGRSVVRLMDGVLLDVRLLDSSDHVEVNRVAAELERLADVGELAILDTAHDGLIPGRVKHDVGAILVRSRGLRVAPENKISGEQTDLSSHLDRVRAKPERRRIVLVQEWLVESDAGSARSVNHASDRPLLCMSAVVIGRGNDNIFADLPIQCLVNVHERD